jgi:hypothetical protein
VHIVKEGEGVVKEQGPVMAELAVDKRPDSP